MPDSTLLPDEISFEQIQELKLENICYQYATRGKWPDRGYFNSTSFFIEKNFLLTSAHNVARTYRNVNFLDIAPARLGDSYHFDKYHMRNVTSNYSKIYPGYKRSKRSTWGPYDMALIYIPDSILEKNPKFSFRNTLPILTDLSSLNVGEKLYCAGYPASDQHKKRYWMTLDESEISEIHEHNFKHKLDTKTGNSGSPIMVKRDDQLYVIGVNSAGYNGTLINESKLIWIEESKKIFMP